MLRKSLITLLTLIIISSSYSFAQVALGVEVGGGTGATKITNVDEYDDMFVNAAATVGLHGMLAVNVGITDRLNLKIGAGIKGQPYQFSVSDSYGFDEIQSNFDTSSVMSKLAASYYFPAIFKFKILKRDSSPFIGLGYGYEQLFNDLVFENKSDVDFEYIKSTLHLVDLQFGYTQAKNDKPWLEFTFSYELGVNNLATESYSFISDGFKIRENSLEFAVAWYFL
jgi:hypothetical protein